MKTLEIIPGPYGGRAAALADGWIVVGPAVDDVDAEFITRVGHRPQLREGKAEADWADAFAALRRKVVCTVRRGGASRTEVLAEADRVFGVAAAGPAAPLAAWCQRQGNSWRLMLWDSRKARTIHESRHALSMPACAEAGGAPLLACESNETGRDMVGLWDGEGRSLGSVDGRRPQLLALDDQAALLLVERVESTEIVSLHAVFLRKLRVERELPLPRLWDYGFNAHVTLDAGSGAVYVVCEACRGWNLDNRLGQHRDICLYVLRPGGSAFEPAEGTCEGRLPLPYLAHWDMTAHNMPPVFPRVAVAAGRPVVGFRRIHFGGHRSYGWHAYLTHPDGGRWSEPARISERLGVADWPWDLFSSGSDVLACVGCCDVRPAVTLEEGRRSGRFDKRDGDASRHAHDFRLEVVACRPGEALPEAEIPTPRLAPYLIPPRLHGVCPEPAELPAAPKGLRLVWGDLHPHSVFSKCMAPDDGFPQDVLRYQRDVLGCQVLCLVEHATLLGVEEFAWAYDWLEMEAGGRCAVLYGMEPGVKPAHHINFYAADREVFDRLRELTLLRGHQSEIFPRIKEALPRSSVIVARHGHGGASGDFGIRSPRTVELYDGELELAMEAMQLRGDMMVDLNWKSFTSPLFPNNFLNAGAKIALLGGTDHANPPGPNAFCLTGLWVRELTSAGVFEAIQQRRTIAASNAKVAIWVECNGKGAGSELSSAAPVRVTCHLSAGTRLLRVCLMRDGELLPWTQLDGRSATVELVDADPPPGRHWYVVTVQAESVLARQPALAHASPLFVEID